MPTYVSLTHVCATIDNPRWIAKEVYQIMHNCEKFTNAVRKVQLRNHEIKVFELHILLSPGLDKQVFVCLRVAGG